MNLVGNPSPIRVRDRAMSAVSTSEAPARPAAVIWAAMPGHVIDGGEIVLLAIKPSLWRPVFDSASWLLASAIAAIMLLWLGRSIPGLSSPATAQLVISVGFLRLAFAVVRWVPTWYLLTNRRIIYVHGVRAPKVDSHRLLDIRNTYVDATPAEKMTRLGTIRFAIDLGDNRPVYWRSIADPQTVHAKIRRAIENAIDHPS